MSKTSKRLYALLDIIENGVNSVTHFNELMNGDNDNSKYYYGKYKWNKKNNEQALISNRIDEDLKKRNIELCSYFKENDITVHTLDEKTQYGLLNHKNFRKLDVIEKKSLFQAIENRNASNEGRKAYYIENIDKGDKKDQIYEKPKDNNIVVLNLKKNNSYVLLKAYYSSIEENEIIKNKKNKEQLTNNEKMNVRNTAINKMLNHQNDFNNDWRYKTFLFSEQRKFDEENKNADFEISDENKQNNILISEKFDEINGENKKQLINVSVGVAYNIAATIAKHKARKYGGYDAEAAIPMLEKNKIIFINKSQSITKQIIKHKGIDGGLNEDLNKMRLFGFALHFEDNVWFIFLKNNDKYYYISIKDPNGIGESIITISNFISTINTNDN